jgi:putative endonuclease
MFFVYILKSDTTDRSYVGSSHNVAERIRRHNAGHAKSTKHGIPWQLVHLEAYDTRSDAVRREGYLKTGVGREEVARFLLTFTDSTC